MRNELHRLCPKSACISVLFGQTGFLPKTLVLSRVNWLSWEGPRSKERGSPALSSQETFWAACQLFGQTPFFGQSHLNCMLVQPGANSCQILRSSFGLLPRISVVHTCARLY